jgi:polar amino acid transport system substrate-binding protein
MAKHSTPVRLALLTLLAAVAAGCAPADEGSSTATPGATAGAAGACGKDSLATQTKGKLTVATDEPAYEPWFKENQPANGQGFESAVAYAVAEKLGFAKDDVVWTRVTFNTAVAPGPKDFDFDINQFTISEERRKAVDFSTPYYDVRQAVIALKTSKIAGVKSLRELAAAKLGAQVGTTSYNAIVGVIKPSGQPAVFNTNDDAKKALQNGTIDGLVVDLPTAFFMTAAEIEDSVIVGQVPQPAGAPELT